MVRREDAWLGGHSWLQKVVTSQREDANQQADLASGQQRYLHAVAGAFLLFLPGAQRGPDARAQDDQIEDSHHDQPRHVQSHLQLFMCLLPVDGLEEEKKRALSSS